MKKINIIIIIIMIIIQLRCWFRLEWVARFPCLFWVFSHSILFAASTLVSFQFLRSSFIVSLHVFLGQPRPRCPLTSSAVMLLIQPSFFATWPNQRNRLYRSNVCMLLIPNFFQERVWTNAIFQAHITYPTNHSTIITFQLRSSLLTLGTRHSLAYRTRQIHVLKIYSRKFLKKIFSKWKRIW